MYTLLLLLLHVPRTELLFTLSMTSLVISLKIIYLISDCNESGTHNHLVRKRTLNHLPKLAK